MNREACCSSSCCYSSLQRTVRNYSRLSSLAIRIFSKLLPSFSCHNDGFFRKPTSPPLPLMRDFFLKSPRPSFIDKAGCTRQFESELSLRSFAQLFPIKEGSTSHLGLLPSGEKRKPLLLVARNHFILWLADHQRSSPAAELRFAVCDRMDKEERNGCRKPKKPIAARHEAHSSTP